MIIALPLNLPKIEPDNWDVFWNIWNTHSDYAIKIKQNYKNSVAKVGSNFIWKGLDIYKKELLIPAYVVPFYDISTVLPKMYKFLHSLNDLLNIRIYRIRLLQSLVKILPHTDDDRDSWSLRAFLYSPSPKDQWFFVRPNTNNKIYLKMPNDTNWFCYNDKYVWHGTDFDENHKKILIQVFFIGNINDAIIKESLQLYNNYKLEI